MNRKRIQRLMELMGTQAVYPKPKLSLPEAGHKKYPYLLRRVKVDRVDQVCSTEITCIRMAQGFVMRFQVLAPISGGRDGLVQPVRAELVAFADDGSRFLQ